MVKAYPGGSIFLPGIQGSSLHSRFGGETLTYSGDVWILGQVCGNRGNQGGVVGDKSGEHGG